MVVPHIKKNDGGVLCLPCAAGKTVLSLYLACMFKVKTLVIVHKTFLLNQWKERAEQFTDAKIGIIQQDKIEVDGNDIVIGMLQSIAKDKYDADIFRDFGMVIFDEAHHAPSQYFSRALPLIASKLTIGLSATPKRSDKLEKILYWYFGDIMYKTAVEENNRVLVKIINYDIEHEKFKEFFMRTGDVNRAKTINKITTIGRRNKFIIDMMEEVLIEDKRKILILSDRIEHLNALKKRLDEREITTTDYYVGGMKQKALKQAELAQVIFASYGMASEALDIPDLNTLFMVTSRREVEQAVGRVIRKIDPNVRPTIYDFTDMLPSFVNQGYNRRKLYRKMGFEIKIIETKNGEIINMIQSDEINELKECVDDVECEFID
jgi:superfamily II DNA or RNA helicase